MGKFDITEIPLSTITTGLEGKIIGIYGMNNVGKSYVAAHLFPGQTLWVATERGYNAQYGLRPYDVETWTDFRDVVAQLTTRSAEKRKKVREMYKCVVVDVADRLPAMSDGYIINQYNLKNSDREDFTQATEIGDIPYGGGYSSSRRELDKQITKLADEYIAPKNTMSKTGNVLKDTPDFMIYVESQGVDVNGKPILSIGHCVQHKEFFARSRFTQCVRIACEREIEIQNGVGVTFEEAEEAREQQKKDKTKTPEELVEDIKPIFNALLKNGQKSYAESTMKQYLGVDDKGKPRKFGDVNANDVEGLTFIYNNLVDFAEEKNIAW